MTIVLFDLDGTLSDSQPGIIGSLRKAFADLGLPPMDDATAFSLLGPPFYESLPPIVGLENVPAIIDRYRVHYATGMFDTQAYDGIDEVLAELRRRGVTMAVATSKPEAYAIPIVEHLGLTEYFAVIGGDALDGSRGTKALVVGDVLRRLGEPDPARMLMVGDRSHDVHGAAAHGIACLGASWGYGAPGELAEAGAREIFPTPRDLLGALDRLLGADVDATGA